MLPKDILKQVLGHLYGRHQWVLWDNRWGLAYRVVYNGQEEGHTARAWPLMQTRLNAAGEDTAVVAWIDNFIYYTNGTHGPLLATRFHEGASEYDVAYAVPNPRPDIVLGNELFETAWHFCLRPSDGKPLFRFYVMRVGEGAPQDSSADECYEVSVGAHALEPFDVMRARRLPGNVTFESAIKDLVWSNVSTSGHGDSMALLLNRLGPHEDDLLTGVFVQGIYERRFATLFGVSNESVATGRLSVKPRDSLVSTMPPAAVVAYDPAREIKPI
jgi:hypothetical protein